MNAVPRPTSLASVPGLPYGARFSSLTLKPGLRM